MESFTSFSRRTNWSAISNFSHISVKTQQHLRNVYINLTAMLFLASAGTMLHFVTNLGSYGLLTFLGTGRKSSWNSLSFDDSAFIIIIIIIIDHSSQILTTIIMLTTHNNFNCKNLPKISRYKLTHPLLLLHSHTWHLILVHCNTKGGHI